MPEMPSLAKAVTTSAPYRLLARRVLLPWVLQGEQSAGEGLEIGASSGAMIAQLLAAFPGLRMIATDYDTDMVATARQSADLVGPQGAIPLGRHHAYVVDVGAAGDPGAH